MTREKPRAGRQKIILIFSQCMALTSAYQFLIMRHSGQAPNCRIVKFVQFVAESFRIVPHLGFAQK
jgi:hypothetical protein